MRKQHMADKRKLLAELGPDAFQDEARQAAERAIERDRRWAEYYWALHSDKF